MDGISPEFKVHLANIIQTISSRTKVSQTIAIWSIFSPAKALVCPPFDPVIILSQCSEDSCFYTAVVETSIASDLEIPCYALAPEAVQPRA